jgi:hypothetical protein
VCRLLIWRLAQTRPHGRQAQQIVILPAHDHPQPTRSEQIGQRSRIAIQAIQAGQHLGEGDSEFGRIAGDRVSGPQQFPAVIAVSSVPKSAYPLMRMGLEHDGSSSDDFSAFASQIPWSADLIKATMRSGKLWRVRQRPLPGGLPGPVHIDHQPVLALPIPDASRRGAEWRSRDQIFLKHGSQCLHRRLIQGRQKPAERRAMRETVAIKERHEGTRKRQETCVKGFERGLPESV